MRKKRSGSSKRASPSYCKNISSHLHNCLRSMVVTMVCLATCMTTQAQLGRIEKHILEDFTEDRTNTSTHIFKDISNSVNYVSIGLPAGLLMTGILTHNPDMRKKGLYVAESAIVSGIVTFGLKYGVNRARPFKDNPLIIAADRGGSPSFPSGHTSEAFSTATSISIAYPKWYIIVPSFAWASAVGYSRMYLGVHYPSDVIAGALVGSASAWITWKANKWLAGKKHAALWPAN